MALTEKQPAPPAPPYAEFERERGGDPDFQVWDGCVAACAAAGLTNKVPKKKAAKIMPKLTECEQDLLSEMQKGYQLETDSLGGNPVLRRLKDGEVIRPLSANASSVKALQERGLIHAVKGRDPLIMVWHLRKKQE